MAYSGAERVRMEKYTRKEQNRVKKAQLERIASIDANLNINRERLEEIQQEDIRKDIMRHSADLEAEKQRIIAKIQQLPRAECIEVLYLYYVRFLRTSAIAEQMDCSIRKVKRLKQEAIAEFEQLPEESECIT